MTIEGRDKAVEVYSASLSGRPSRRRNSMGTLSTYMATVTFLGLEVDCG